MPVKSPGAMPASSGRKPSRRRRPSRCRLPAGPLLAGAGRRVPSAAGQRPAAYFTALGDALKDSKTFGRLPAAAQAFIAHATKDGPLETVYLDTPAFTTYWQSKGIDPALVAQELLGNTTAYPEALRTGEALAIPTAAYAVRIATGPHNTFFAQELRVAPGEMNAREATVYGEALERSIAEATAAAAAAPHDRADTRPSRRPDLCDGPDAARAGGAVAHAGARECDGRGGGLSIPRQRAGVDPVALFTSRGWIIGGPATVDEATLRTREAARAPRAPVIPSEETADARRICRT